MTQRNMIGRVLPVIFLGTTAYASALPEARALMPVPAETLWVEGDLPIGEGFSVAAKGPEDVRVSRAIERFSSWLTREAKRAAPPKLGGEATAAGLTIEWTSAGAPVQTVREDESYELTVGAEGARLVAPNALGVLHGLTTFRQLVRVENGKAAAAAVRIKDRPRFAWRGLLLDPCRHWLPVEVVKRTLDGMSAVKLNVLHWHLSEDQGFRAESKVHPKLHENGSDGLFYTQAQMRDVVAYARDLGIRVVPEFDMPGHSTSWLVGYPELGSAPGPFEIARTFGIHDNNLDPSKEEVYQFVEKLWAEMAALFPDEYAHIGGDEVTLKQWNANSTIQEFMYPHKLRDPHDLQAYFNKRVVAMLTKLGKKVVGWDEVIHPELPKSMVVQSWRGIEGLRRATEQGYDSLLSAPYYLDHMRSAGTHYLADPIPEGSDLTEEQRKHVLGGEACMWAEFVSPENVDVRIWPRAAAIAERLWSPGERRDVDDMYRRLARQSERLEEYGLTHRKAPEAALLRLAGKHPVAPLRVLADVVESVKEYKRIESLPYRTNMPLDRLVDAIRAESDTARQFRRDVDLWLAGEPSMSALRRPLDQWSHNHEALDPLLAASPKLAEVRTLSMDLYLASQIAQECLDLFMTDHPKFTSWYEERHELLDRASKSRGELELAVLPGIRKMLLAAQHRKTLWPMPRSEWNAWLDAKMAEYAAAKAEGSLH